MANQSRQNNATEGRVYGGDCGLIHIADGERNMMGQMAALYLEHQMRDRAYEQGRRSIEEANGQDLCPGCYMVAGFDMMVHLAQKNGQSLKELGLSMAKAFAALADCDEGDEACIEEIGVVLDKSFDASKEVNAELSKLEDQVKAGLR